MHDVLDDRDLVPDEAEQLLHSGYRTAQNLADAREAATAGDYGRLTVIRTALTKATRNGEWTYVEPEDEETLLAFAASAPFTLVDPATLPDRIHGAWLGRCVANTMGKPIEGLTRDEVRIYLSAVGRARHRGYRSEERRVGKECCR